MNHEALLALIADLYAQLGQAQRRIAELEKEASGEHAGSTAD